MFYEKLQKELKKKNTNLNQLAKATGINQSATSRYKNGSMPTTEILIKICKYLDVSADYLLDLDDTPPPDKPNLSDRETILIENFRLCKPETQGNIELLASSGAEEALKQETSSELKNIS